MKIAKTLLILLIILFVLSYSKVAKAEPNNYHWRTIVTGGWAPTKGECGKNEEKVPDHNCPQPKPSDRINGYSICCKYLAPKDIKVSKPKFIMPELQISIPGLKLTPSSSIEYIANSDGSYEAKIPWLSEYILALYNYGLSIAGILAALVLMGGGVLWLTSAGNAGRLGQAKELIAGSISGLIILFSSYLILVQINPDLIQLKPVKIGVIKNLTLTPDGSDSADNLGQTMACPNDDDLININGINSIRVSGSVSDPRLTSSAWRALKGAGQIAQAKGVRLLVTSAHRSYNKQKELWDRYLAKFNGDEAKTKIYVANPSNCQGNTCYSHCSGQAVDVCLNSSPSCKKMNAKGASASSPDITKLQAIMKQAGWIRYCNEWWHFQYNLRPGKACSP